MTDTMSVIQAPRLDMTDASAIAQSTQAVQTHVVSRTPWSRKASLSYPGHSPYRIKQTLRGMRLHAEDREALPHADGARRRGRAETIMTELSYEPFLDDAVQRARKFFSPPAALLIQDIHRHKSDWSTRLIGTHHFQGSPALSRQTRCHCRAGVAAAGFAKGFTT
jgi:hypothetical protein